MYERDYVMKTSVSLFSVFILLSTLVSVISAADVTWDVSKHSTVWNSAAVVLGTIVDVGKTKTRETAKEANRRKVKININEVTLSDENIEIDQELTISYNTAPVSGNVVGEYRPETGDIYFLFLKKETDKPLVVEEKKGWKLLNAFLKNSFFVKEGKSLENFRSGNSFSWHQVSNKRNQEVHRIRKDVITTRIKSFTNEPNRIYNLNKDKLNRRQKRFVKHYPEHVPERVGQWIEKLKAGKWPTSFDRVYWWNTAFVSGTVTSVNSDARTMQVKPSTVHFNDQPITSDGFQVSYPDGIAPKKGKKYMLYLTYECDSDGKQDGGWTLLDKPFSLFPSGKPILKIGDRPTGELKWLEHKVRVARLKTYKNIEELVRDN